MCCGAHQTKALSRSRKFRLPKMNLNAFLCRFPTVFGKYITILDQVSKIRRFHSIPFEFQGFDNRPQISFLPFRILYCKPILRALSNNNNNNNIFISYIKYTNITPPANSKANRGRWCVEGLRFITNS